MNISVRQFLNRYGGLLSLSAYFGAKIIVGLALLKLSAELLTTSAFALFSQFVLLWALLSLVASGGVQNGLIRQIASASGPVAARTAFHAGMRIWAAASLVLCLLILFKEKVSVVLVGDISASWIVPWLAVAALAGGFGQLCSSVLIGSGRLIANVVSQSAGLIAGFVAAAACLYWAEAGWAVIAFAGGSLLTPLTAALLVRTTPALSRGATSGVGAEMRALLGYSGTFIAIALVSPLVLFTLRYFYLEAFGTDALADWLVANRISDVSTQLIGLFMVQWYLPKVASTEPGTFKTRTIITTFLVGSAVMLFLLGVFLVGAPTIVPLFLSDQYLSASTLIATYMLGDVLRVSVSMAVHHALARRSLWTYLGIEVAAAALIGILVGIGIQQNRIDAPYFGYVGAYALLTAIVCAAFLLRRAREGSQPGIQTGGRGDE